MAKGAVAKTNVINKIAMAFGSDYIGEVDKKIYVWANDGGEKVQIAIALTCPKTMVESVNAPASVDKTGWNFEDEPVTTPAPTVARPKMTQEEIDKAADLMARLGL